MEKREFTEALTADEMEMLNQYRKLRRQEAEINRMEEERIRIPIIPVTQQELQEIRLNRIGGRYDLGVA